MPLRLPAPCEPLPVGARLDTGPGATVVITVTPEQIAAKPPKWSEVHQEYRYSSFSTPIALALNAALGGRWMEGEQITPDSYEYADWESQWSFATPKSRMRFVTFGADAYRWMRDWSTSPDPISIVQPATFVGTFSTTKRLPLGLNSQLRDN